MDEALLPLVQDFLRKAEGQCEVILPEDFIVVNADQFHAYVESGRAGNPVGWRCVRADEILSSDLPVDIGPETVKLIQGLIKSPRTVF